MWKDTLNKVIEEMSEYNRTPPPPASDMDIQTMLAELPKLGNVKSLPDTYIEFLKIMNGLNWNGLFIYSSKSMPIAGTDVEISGIVAANEIWRDFEPHEQYLFVGDGNISLYGQDLNTGEYKEFDRSSDTVIQVYEDFESMLIAALNTSLD
ncbi:MAG: YrhA family protein [Desulfobacteraceae bacterium]|jgi:hypothetical protein